MKCEGKEDLKEDTISCGNAGECYYDCEQKKCNKDGVIDARNANNFYVNVGDSGDECLGSGAIIYLPTNGNAYFTTSGSPKSVFMGLHLIAGANTGKVHITIGSASIDATEAMHDMTLNVASAEELLIKIDGNAEIHDSDIYCPDYPTGTRYQGTLPAPCVIDFGSGGSFLDDDQNTRNMIYVPNGIPKGLVFPNGIAYSVGWTTIDCSGRVDSLNGDQGAIDYLDDSDYYGPNSGPGEINSDCYWTEDPTSAPTQSPTTASPTETPSESPSKNPTDTPSSSPSVSPSTSTPSSSPSMKPSKSPSESPSLSPSSIPSISPSDSPSIEPTNYPSSDPSESPSKSPSKTPTSAPSKSPLTESKDPTLSPSNSPTSLSMDPSASPSNDPSISPTSISSEPSLSPSEIPSESPSLLPSMTPSTNPSKTPSISPSAIPTGLIEDSYESHFGISMYILCCLILSFVIPLQSSKIVFVHI